MYSTRSKREMLVRDFFTSKSFDKMIGNINEGILISPKEFGKSLFF